MFKDVHTPRYVLFYETLVFLEPREILDLAKQGWPFPGNWTAVTPAGMCRSLEGDFGEEILLVLGKGPLPNKPCPVLKEGGRRRRGLRRAASTLAPGHGTQTGQPAHRFWLIREMLGWKGFYFPELIGWGPGRGKPNFLATKYFGT